MPFRWNDALVEELRSMWASDWTGSQIAAALVDPEGFMTTRNAVIAKANRLKLTSRKRVIATPIIGLSRTVADTCRDNATRESIKRKISNQKRRNHRGHIVTPALPVEFLPTPEAASETAVTLVDIAPGGCHWPVGDSLPQLFCNADRAPGPLCYCARHLAMVYVKPKSPMQISSLEHERRSKVFQKIYRIHREIAA